MEIGRGEPARAHAAGRPWLGLALRYFVAGLLAAVLLDTWLVSGLLRPVVVASGSMAPALLGPHRAWSCARCGQEFSCSLGSLPGPRSAAICPYCYAQVDGAAGVDRPGQRVLVDRAAFVWRAPRRFEMVVLDCPSAWREWCVKRVVGLPGERVSLRSGDVWIDGQRVAKSWADARAMAVLVHAAPAADKNAAGTPARWRDASGGWRHEGDRFVHHRGAAGASAPVDWLAYHHPRGATAEISSPDAPLVDESPFNQVESRPLNPVRDVLVSAKITCGPGGELLLRSRAGGDAFELRLDLARDRGTLAHNGQVIDNAIAAAGLAGRTARCEWAILDGQVLLAIDGREVARSAWQPRDPSAESGSAPLAEPLELAIGARGAEVSLADLRLLRDVYYTPGRGPSGTAEYRLGPDEYLLLGDNSAHSQDGRTWQPAGVAGKHIVGRVLQP